MTEKPKFRPEINKGSRWFVNGAKAVKPTTTTVSNVDDSKSGHVQTVVKRSFVLRCCQVTSGGRKLGARVRRRLRAPFRKTGG
jgi:hypothetical protein